MKYIFLIISIMGVCLYIIELLKVIEVKNYPSRIIKAIKNNNYISIYKLVNKAKKEIAESYIKSDITDYRVTFNLLNVSFLNVIENHNSAVLSKHQNESIISVEAAYNYAKFIGKHVFKEICNKPQMLSICGYLEGRCYFLISIDETISFEEKISLLHSVGHVVNKQQIYRHLKSSNPEFAECYKTYIKENESTEENDTERAI